MIIEILAILSVVMLLLLPLCLFPIFLAKAVNVSLEMTESKKDSEV